MNVFRSNARCVTNPECWQMFAFWISSADGCFGEKGSLTASLEVRPRSGILEGSSVILQQCRVLCIDQMVTSRQRTAQCVDQMVHLRIFHCLLWETWWMTLLFRSHGFWCYHLLEVAKNANVFKFLCCGMWCLKFLCKFVVIVSETVLETFRKQETLSLWSSFLVLIDTQNAKCPRSKNKIDREKFEFVLWRKLIHVTKFPSNKLYLFLQRVTLQWKIFKWSVRNSFA